MLLVVTMLRWRTLLLLLLLTLSLPIGALAAPSSLQGGSHAMNHAQGCAMSHANAAQASHVVMNDAACHHDLKATSAAHSADSCGMCATCLAGAVAPTPVGIAPCYRVVIRRTLRPASDAVPRFLTSGIERPPRLFLA